MIEVFILWIWDKNVMFYIHNLLRYILALFLASSGRVAHSGLDLHYCFKGASFIGNVRSIMISHSFFSKNNVLLWENWSKLDISVRRDVASLHI